MKNTDYETTKVSISEKLDLMLEAALHEGFLQGLALAIEELEKIYEEAQK